MNRPAVLLSALALALAGCGLQPMYAGGGHGLVATGMASIDVPPIEGKAGWLMRNALIDRLNPGGSPAGPTSRYRLDVRTCDGILESLACRDTGRDFLGCLTASRRRIADHLQVAQRMEVSDQVLAPVSAT